MSNSEKQVGDSITAESRRTLEDPLHYLPRVKPELYKRKQYIYGPHRSSLGLYWLMDGRVKVSRLREDGSEAAVPDIFGRDSLFGEACFLGGTKQSERARALEDSVVMYWSFSLVVERMHKKPDLGLALFQMQIQRKLESRQRYERFMGYSVPQRVHDALLRLVEEQGVPEEEGWMELPPTNHVLIAGCAKINRTQASKVMARLRRMGAVRYKSGNVIVVDVEAVKTELSKSAKHRRQGKR